MQVALQVGQKIDYTAIAVNDTGSETGDGNPFNASVVASDTPAVGLTIVGNKLTITALAAGFAAVSFGDGLIQKAILVNVVAPYPTDLELTASAVYAD